MGILPRGCPLTTTRKTLWALFNMLQKLAGREEHLGNCWNWTKNREKKEKDRDEETWETDTHTLFTVPAPTITAPPVLQGPPCGPSKQMTKTLNLEKDHTALHILYISLSYIWFATKENKWDQKTKTKKHKTKKNTHRYIWSVRSYAWRHGEGSRDD
jgi:hypothetical protein